MSEKTPRDSLERDLECLATIGDELEGLIEGLVVAGSLQKTLRRWFSGHADPPEDPEAQDCLMAMAADLEMFTPSPSGRTLVDRRLAGRTLTTDEDRSGLKALAAAQFRLVQIVDRLDPDQVALTDLVTGERLVLLDDRISPLAAGACTAMRLCPTDGGRQLLISPLFAMDQAQLERSKGFVRNGRPLGNGHRCAANLYRDVARSGFQPLPQLELEMDDDFLEEFLSVAQEQMSEVNQLALTGLAAGLMRDDPEWILTARSLATAEHLIDCCGHYGQMENDGPTDLRDVYRQIAELQVETLVNRARAGLSAGRADLDRAAERIADFVARGVMEPSAAELLSSTRARWEGSSEKRTAPGNSAEAATIQRILALRAKTTDRGCTEAEAMAAAEKIAELLERYDLTLDEISLRQSECEAVTITTARRRRMPIDSCVPAVAEFCDCTVWSQQDEAGSLQLVFFGLKSDVGGARLLYDLIEASFETESALFRKGEIYRALRGPDRRLALNSFQVGLAGGLFGKLTALKAARQPGTSCSTGFDLVIQKRDKVEAELTAMGLELKHRSSKSRRLLLGDAYEAGKAKGALFEPHDILSE